MTTTFDTEPEFFGLIAQSAADRSVLVAIRGTDTLLRIVNRPDIVPRLPPLYDPVGNEIDFDSTTYPAVAHSLACYHTLTTYLWLLDQESSFGLSTCSR